MLQSNNYDEIEDHTNCKNSVDDCKFFKTKCLQEIYINIR